MTVLWFFIGLFVGGGFGVLIMAFMQASHEADIQEEKDYAEFLQQTEK